MIGRWAPLLAGQGVGDVLLPYPRPLAARRQLARALAADRADVALLLPNSLEAALAATRWRARRRVGYATDGRRALLTDAMPLPAPRLHQVDEYAALLSLLGLDGASPAPEWKLPACPTADAEVAGLLAGAELDASAPLVGLHLGAAFGSSKLWPPEAFGRLARELAASGLCPVLLGTAEDAATAADVAHAAGMSLASLVGRDRPALLARLLARFRCLVSGDTGVAHLAAAVGRGHRDPVRPHRPAPDRAARAGGPGSRAAGPVRAVLPAHVSDRPHLSHADRSGDRAARGEARGRVKTVLHTEASPGLGGQEVRTLNEARWTAERGWRVLLACQPDGRLLERAREAGVETAAIRMRGPLDPVGLVALARLIRRERVDLVHTHSSIDAWLGGMAARLCRVPVVRTRHVSIAIRRGLNPVYRWLADRVITSGEAIRQVVVGAGAPPERVVAIPAGVNLETFPFGRRAPDTARALDLGSPVIGSVAMFRGSKGHPQLLQAFAQLREKRPSASLLLVGDGIRRAWVQQLAQAAGLAESVVFTGFRPDVPALLATMDCFVLASTRTEGVPQALLQAFATGVPVVASRIGGIPEVVTDGETGLLVESDSVPALVAAIGRVLDDPDASARRARAARALVEAHFSHARSIDRLLDLYEELLA